jgi:dephospho-CoA kinase
LFDLIKRKVLIRRNVAGGMKRLIYFPITQVTTVLQKTLRCCKMLCMVKIIILDGMTGSGKSTTADILSRQMYITAVHADEIMYESVVDMPNEMNNLFGEKKAVDETCKQFVNRKVFASKDAKLRRAFFDVNRPYIEENVNEIIHKLSQCIMPKRHLDALKNVHLGSDLFAVEWFLSSAGQEIWPRVLKRIIISTNSGLCTERAKQRGDIIGLDDPEIVKTKQEAYLPIINCAKDVDYRIENNSDLQDLEKRLSVISGEICNIR